MRPALDERERSVLERIVGRCRSLLEEDLASQAAGRMGIDLDGTVAEEEDLALDASGRADRREVVEVVTHFVSEGSGASGAVARMLREATFTHLNRLVAIRIAEAQGLLLPSIAAGRASSGYRDFLELAPLLSADDDGGYGAYLALCGDELAGDVPALFDPRNPLLALAPSPAGLDGIVEMLADPTNAALWEAADCLGWVYQFFNTAEERKAMRDASPAPRDSRELAVRNQFFTPRYVVDFLVQNTLGRRLAEADPSSPLLADLPLLVDPPAGPGERVALEEVSVLDPACGSGHFLLAAYDVLERAYQHLGVQPSESAPLILKALWGIDIDARCVQVASAALSFRARRSGSEVELPRPNVICARSLPVTASGLSELQKALPPKLRGLVRQMTETLESAPVLGPLLKVEKQLQEGAWDSFLGGRTGPGRRRGAFHQEASLADVAQDQVASIEDELLGHLRLVAAAATSSATERLLAAEASDAVRFVEAMRRRYDAVVMNPPFGEPVPETKGYLRAAYEWLPGHTSDLLAAFVGRGLELCKPNGYLGAITNRTALFIKSFEAWRRKVLLRNELVCLADLGYGVMEGAMVEAAAYVVRAKPSTAGSVSTFLRLLKDKDRPVALAEAVSHVGQGLPEPRVTKVVQEEFKRLPQAPIAYAMGLAVRQLIAEGPPLEGHAGEARIGLQTSDDFRFIRAFWEVKPERIARSREATFEGRKWVPLAKGGDYAPYWSDIHLVVNWGNDGEELKAFRGATVANAQYFFRPGITWPRMTASALSARPISGCIFSNAGGAVFGDAPYQLLGWLNSRLVRLLLATTDKSGEETASGAPHQRYDVGRIQSLPAPRHVTADGMLAGEAKAVADLLARQGLSDETARDFLLPMAYAHPGPTLRDRFLSISRERLSVALDVLSIYAEIDDRIATLVDLDEATGQELDEVIGPLISRLPEVDLSDQEGEVVRRLLTEPMGKAIHLTVQARGEARFLRIQHHVADRRLELASLAVQRSPRSIARFAEEHRLVAPEVQAESALDVVSYIIGAAFGRWDVRYAVSGESIPETRDAFAPVPVCPPGQLVGGDGLPASSAPVGYPLELPPSGILLDEPGHRFDIERRAVAAAEVVLGADAEGVLAEALEVLGARSLRQYLRRGFFRDHLARYSKSRRHAPIYWPLYVPSGNWGVWLYAPRLSREMLFAVVQAAATREAAATAEISRLQRDRESGGAGLSARQVAAALEAEEQLAQELKVFRTEAERIAGLGWEPDLDDGAVLCAAPLADLFPAWDEAARYRRELREGKYPWASVAKWATEL